MVKDRNKQIYNIKYNHLNLPTTIYFENGSFINYLYNAVGTKLGKTVTSVSPESGSVATQTDYLNGFQYKYNELQFFPTAEGYVSVIEGQKFNYVFNYTDHLGNIRLSYTQSGTELKIMEQNHYYPFGLKHSNYNTDIARLTKSADGISVIVRPTERSDYQYKYNGKEYQDELGLNVTAMDYRQYDSAIGRFNGMDRLAELVPNMTPYRFAFNNPNFWADPTGLLEQNIENLEHCPTCPNTPEFKPLIDDPNNTYVYDPETKQASFLLDEVVVTATGNNQSDNNNNWWIIDWLPNRNRNFDRPVNITLGAYGAVATTTEAWLHSERKAFEKRGTKTATKKINKYVKPSINKVNKFSKRLGVAGAAYSAGSLGHDIVSGQEITAGQVFDTALSVTLCFIAISNPVGLLALGAYTVIDMYGELDGIKESLGMDNVIINKK